MLRKLINHLKFFIYINKNKYFSYIEYKKLTLSISQIKNLKTPIVVCDLKCIPKTYGNFCQVIFLSLFLKIKFGKCKFLIIKDTNSSNWERIKKNKIIKLLNDYRKISSFFLGPKNIQIKEINWDQFEQKYIKEKDENYFIVFRKFIKIRKSIHYLSFNLINIFLTNNSHLEKKFLLLGSKTFLNSNFKNLNGNYLTLSARYSINSKNNIHSKNINKSDNNQVSDIRKIIKKIREKKLNKNKKIVIITSKEGMKYYKKKINLNYVNYSFQYTKSFLGHVELILNSQKYFSFGASGIVIFPLLSSKPYLISWSHEPNQEYHHSPDKYVGWQKTNQKTIFYCNLKTYLASI